MNARQLKQVADVRQMFRSGDARDLRLRVGASLSEVADAAGVSVAALWRYENNRRVPRTPQALSLARVYAHLSEARR